MIAEIHTLGIPVMLWVSPYITPDGQFFKELWLDHTRSKKTVWFVNAANPIGNLTRAQVRDIFTGAIQNWKEVGGSDAPIHLFIRDPISGTHLGFRELAMENKPYADTPNLLTNYEAIVVAVARDANGIGYSSIELESNAGVKPVSIGGIAPNAADVDKGNYPYARVLHLYTSKGHETQEALNFIHFVLSAKGQEILTRTGYTPHS